jgi:CRISPR-associated endoribonuclease Cas6
VNASASPMLPDPFPVCRYRLEFETENEMQLPEYAGSALRGVFGHALRQLACVTSQPECKGCQLQRSCPYTVVFETAPPVGTTRIFSDIPHPYVVEPPAWGEHGLARGSLLRFDLVLIGPALRHVPLVLMAWQRALASGIGPRNSAARLVRVFAEGLPEPVLANPAWRLAEHASTVALPAPESAPDEATVEFTTPLRLKREGQVQGAARLTTQDLLMGLVNRVANVAELQLGIRPGWDFSALKRAAGDVEGDKQLQWREWSRYSQRQKQSMMFGGVVGRWRLRGDLRAFWPLLHLGQWLHIGGKTTFGLGRYTILDARATSP